MIRRVLKWLHTHLIGRFMAFFEAKSAQGTTMFAAEPSKRVMVYRRKDMAYPTALYLTGDNVDDAHEQPGIPAIHNCQATFQSEGPEDVPVFFHPLPLDDGADKGVIQTSLRYNPNNQVWTAYFLAKNTGSFPVYVYSRVRDGDVPDKNNPGEGVHLFGSNNETVFTTNERPLILLNSHLISLTWTSPQSASQGPSETFTDPTSDDMSGTDSQYAVAEDTENPDDAGWTRDIYCTLVDNVSETLAGSSVQYIAYDINSGRQRRWTALFTAKMAIDGWSSVLAVYGRFYVTMNAMSSASLLGYTGSRKISGSVLRARHPEDFYPNSTYNAGSPVGHGALIVGGDADEYFMRSSNNGFYRSTDGGASWSALAAPPQNNSDVGWTLYKMDDVGGWVIYGIVSGLGGVLSVSTDNMQSWTEQTVPDWGRQYAPNQRRLYAVKPGVLIYAMIGTFAKVIDLHRSTDNGATWSLIATETMYRAEGGDTDGDGRLVIGGRSSSYALDGNIIRADIDATTINHTVESYSGYALRSITAKKGGSLDWVMINDDGGSPRMYLSTDGGENFNTFIGNPLTSFDYPSHFDGAAWVFFPDGSGSAGYYTFTEAGVYANESINGAQDYVSWGFDANGRGLAATQDGGFWAAPPGSHYWSEVTQQTISGYNVPLNVG